MSVMPSEIKDLIVSTLPNADASKLDWDTSLRDFGLDSLDLASVFLAIEEKYGIKVPDQDFNALDDIKGIVTYLESRSRERDGHTV
jgi:acyl carrier protein